VAVLTTIVLFPEGDERRDGITSLLGAALLASGCDTSDGRSSPSSEEAADAIKCSNCDDRLCSSLVSNCVCSVPPIQADTPSTTTLMLKPYQVDNEHATHDSAPVILKRMNTVHHWDNDSDNCGTRRRKCPQCHFVHLISSAETQGTEPRSLWWQASN